MTLATRGERHLEPAVAAADVEDPPLGCDHAQPREEIDRLPGRCVEQVPVAQGVEGHALVATLGGGTVEQGATGVEAPFGGTVGALDQVEALHRPEFVTPQLGIERRAGDGIADAADIAVP